MLAADAPTIDMHCHTGDFNPLFHGQHSADDLVAAYDQAGVQLGLLAILARGAMAQANDATIAASVSHPSRILGHMYVDPHDPAAAVSEMQRCAATGHFKGVKLHPSEDAWFPYMAKYYPVYAAAEDLGLPLLFHSGTGPHSNPLGIAYAARDFPKTQFILGHFGLSDLSWECFPAAALASNVLVDTTANPMVRVMAEWVDRFGPERMLWGSDFPFYDVSYELEKLNALAALTTARHAKTLIAGENARRVFDLTMA